MEKIVQKTTEEYIKERGRKKRWQKVVTAMAAVVVFCTTYALIMPAVTQQGQAFCGVEEHKEHTADCYETKQVLTCTLSEEGHEHSSECFIEQPVLSCDIPETDGHSHDASCFAEDGSLICEEIECEPHHHSDSCYTTEEICVCGLEEQPPHQHSEACYTTEETLVCELPIHEHSLQCFSDPEADLETASVWERNFKGIELSGNWSKDVIAIASTQIGYSESRQNYQVRDDGVTMNGYTRYGDWYGIPYGDWCAMFCSFCLNYANVDRAMLPWNSGCESWVETLSAPQYALYHDADTYTPHPGDLIFFDFDGYTDKNERRADHVGFVDELIFDEGTGDLAIIKTIEGNWGDTVCFNYHSVNDSSILGYGKLPVNPESVNIKNATVENGITVTLRAPNYALPYPAEEIALTAELLNNSAAEEILSARLEEEGVTPADMILVDVCLMHDGEEIEPIGPVTLSFETVGVIDTAAVYHVDEEEETVTNMDAEIDEDEGIAVLETEHFSVYALVKDSGKNVTAEVNAIWDQTEGEYSSITVAASCSEQDNMYFCVDRYVDSGWDRLSDWSDKTNRNVTAEIDITDLVQTVSPDTRLRVRGSTATNKDTNAGFSTSFSIKDLLEKEKAGFSGWLTMQTTQPVTISDLYDAFQTYYSLNTTVTAGNVLYAGQTFITCEITNMPEDGSIVWQYENGGVWGSLGCDDEMLVKASEVMSGPANVRCVVFDSESNPVAISSVIYVDPSYSGGDNKPDIFAVWDAENGNISELRFGGTNSDNKNTITVTIQYSDDGTNWTDGTSMPVPKNADYEVPDNGTVNGASLHRIWRIKENNLPTSEVTIFDILEACKAGFSEWLTNQYIQEYGGTALPATSEQLYDAFALYWGLPELSISADLDGGDFVLTAETDYVGSNVHFIWEYYDSETEEWAVLEDENGEAVSGNELNASNYSETKDNHISTVLDGGKDVRCRLYDGTTLKGIAVVEDVDPRAETYSRAIEAINTGLNLAQYPVQVGGAGSYPTINVDLSIHGKKYDNYFYWTNLANDSRVNTHFTDGESYADYLASVYLSYEDSADGLAAVKAIWDRYLFDMYDPLLDTGNYDKRYTYCSDDVEAYPDRDYGDPSKSNIKDKNNTSFHGTADYRPIINGLNTNFLENGVDYANFVTDLEKSASAVAAGDGNTERKYLVDLTADAQAKVVAPVAMVLQIQTSWQMFDLEHANALAGNGDFVEVGAVANNTELANLYAIKNALLQFVDYMDANYHGNNLVLGITETRHDESQTMLFGTDSAGKTIYVTNDYETLRNAIIKWDTFGNCEHVHYTSTDLQNAVKNLSSNLSGWEDFYHNSVEYDDIQKVAVIIGGPTENSSSTNGYGCTLPWGTFTTPTTVTRANGTTARLPILNSVYGIRVNEGTPNSGAPVISWIDYSANNGNTPFKDGVGNAFTDKYIATTEQAVFNALVDIAEKEMTKRGLDLTASDKFVDDVTVSDVVTDEFRLDPDAPFAATVYNSEKYADGDVYSQAEIDWQSGSVTIGSNTIVGTRTETTDTAGNRTIVISFPVDSQTNTLTIVEKADKTTEITYDFGKVYNTKKCNLEFGIVAREDYLGSNNVYTNIGTPSLTYVHYKIDGDGQLTGDHDDYSRGCTDTPQVNVPIRFETTDGGYKKVLTGTTVDLGTDETLDSHTITENIEALVDNYDQTSGTLVYTWVLPNGEEVECGSVVVKNGITQGDFPPLDYGYLVNETGLKTITLNVTFTPEDTVPNNRNFKNDGVTPVPVNEKTLPGRVWVEAVENGSSTGFYVRKVWEGGTPDTNSISFRVSDGSGGYLTGTPDEYRIVDTLADAGVYTVSATDNWQVKFADVPPVKFVDDETVLLNYQPEEIVPNGYAVRYCSTVQTDSIYEGRLNVTLTNNTNADIQKDSIKFVHIEFTYGSHNYTEDIPVTLTGNLAKNGGAVSLNRLMTLPLDSSEQLFSDLNVTSIFTYKKYTAGNGYEQQNYIATANAERVITGSESKPVYVMTNAPATVQVTIEKVVLGPATTQKFDMTAELNEGQFPAPSEDDIYTLDDNGIAHFCLAHGEDIELQVPIGSMITVTETNHDGYYPLIRQGEITTPGDTVTVNIYNDPIVITVENTSGYELPEAGGIGTILYTLSGLVLMTGTLMYGCMLRRKRERRAK